MTRTAICTVEPVISEGGLGMSEVYILSNSLTLREYTYIISIVLFDNTRINNFERRDMRKDDLTYYSETLEADLILDITFVDADPETNYYMFEFDAWDGLKERKEELPQKEWDDCEEIILHHLKGLL